MLDIGFRADSLGLVQEEYLALYLPFASEACSHPSYVKVSPGVEGL